MSIITSRHCIKQNGMNSTVVYLSLYFINLLTTFLTKNAGSLVSISVSKMFGFQPEKLDPLQQVEVLWQIFRVQSMHDQTWFFPWLNFSFRLPLLSDVASGKAFKQDFIKTAEVTQSEVDVLFFSSLFKALKISSQLQEEKWNSQVGFNCLLVRNLRLVFE